MIPTTQDRRRITNKSKFLGKHHHRLTGNTLQTFFHYSFDSSPYQSIIKRIRYQINQRVKSNKTRLLLYSLDDNGHKIHHGLLQNFSPFKRKINIKLSKSTLQMKRMCIPFLEHSDTDFTSNRESLYEKMSFNKTRSRAHARDLESFYTKTDAESLNVNKIKEDKIDAKENNQKLNVFPHLQKEKIIKKKRKDIIVRVIRKMKDLKKTSIRIENVLSNLIVLFEIIIE